MNVIWVLESFGLFRMFRPIGLASGCFRSPAEALLTWAAFGKRQSLGWKSWVADFSSRGQWLDQLLLLSWILNLPSTFLRHVLRINAVSSYNHTTCSYKLEPKKQSHAWESLGAVSAHMSGVKSGARGNGTPLGPRIMQVWNVLESLTTFEININ